MTVRQFTRNSDAKEVAEWLGYYELEDPENAAWQRTAVICMTIVNVGRTVARGRVPAKAKMKDFMPTKRKRLQTGREQLDMLKALTGGPRRKE